MIVSLCAILRHPAQFRQSRRSRWRPVGPAGPAGRSGPRKGGLAGLEGLEGLETKRRTGQVGRAAPLVSRQHRIAQIRTGCNEAGKRAVGVKRGEYGLVAVVENPAVALRGGLL